MINRIEALQIFDCSEQLIAHNEHSGLQLANELQKIKQFRKIL